MLVTYSQNGEDILLYRCFNNLKKGYYVDVGANDPVNESVTKLFYDQGWSGINIEPELDSYNKLIVERPRDKNYNLCVSRKNGSQEFYQVLNTGLSSLYEENAKNAEKEGFKVKKTIVHSLGLTDILDKENLFKQEIHFLKIDTEGSEEEVIKSLDLQKYRPWIIIIEAMTPHTNMDSSFTWEKYIIDNGYKSVFFDGLNKYFIAKEKYETYKDNFSRPANILDGFIRFREWKLFDEADLKEKLLKNSEVNLENSMQKNNMYNKVLLDINLLLNKKQERIDFLEKEYNKHINKIKELEIILGKSAINSFINFYYFLAKVKRKSISMLNIIIKLIRS